MSSHFILALDLETRSHGAIEVARWLADRLPDARLSAIHVVEEHALTERSWTAQVIGAARDQAAAALAAGGLADRVSDLQVVPARRAEDLLAAAATDMKADALIIGRAARRDSSRLVRLGRVARRLLRSLPVPVLVAPPDLSAADLGEGPVLVGVDGRPECLAATRWATGLARALGREVVLAHIVALPPVWPDYLGSVDTALLHAQVMDRARPRLVDWQHTHGLGALRLEVSDGYVVDQLVSLAAREGACAIVSGSGGLGVAARVFQSSVGSALAAHTRLPALVVPPVP